MKILAVFTLSLILVNPVFPQHKAFSKEHEIWLDGYAYLNSGEKVKGKINYNFVSENIRVQQGDEIKTLPANKVNRFIQYDSTRQKITYYSFPISRKGKKSVINTHIGLKAKNDQYSFLLVLHQNNKGALLSNLDINIKYTNSGPGNVNGIPIGIGFEKHKEKIEERIYFLDKRGFPIEILEGRLDKFKTVRVTHVTDAAKYEKTNFNPNQTSNQESDLNNSLTLKDADKFSVSNKDFLEELDPRNYRKLEAYIEKNEVDIKTIEGLTQLIDYWAEF